MYHFVALECDFQVFNHSKKIFSSKENPIYCFSSFSCYFGFCLIRRVIFGVFDLNLVFLWNSLLAELSEISNFGCFFLTKRNIATVKLFWKNLFSPQTKRSIRGRSDDLCQHGLLFSNAWFVVAADCVTHLPWIQLSTSNVLKILSLLDRLLAH